MALKLSVQVFFYANLCEIGKNKQTNKQNLLIARVLNIKLDLFIYLFGAQKSS